MALTSSISRIIPQGADQLVTEHHVDSVGVIHVWTYSTGLETDTAAILAAHNAQLDQELQALEAEELLNG